MSNVKGKGGGNPTDGGIRPVHESASSSGWIWYSGDEGTEVIGGDGMTYFGIEEVSW